MGIFKYCIGETTTVTVDKAKGVIEVDGAYIDLPIYMDSTVYVCVYDDADLRLGLGYPDLDGDEFDICIGVNERPSSKYREPCAEMVMGEKDIHGALAVVIDEPELYCEWTTVEKGMVSIGADTLSNEMMAEATKKLEVSHVKRVYPLICVEIPEVECTAGTMLSTAWNGSGLWIETAKAIKDGEIERKRLAVSLDLGWEYIKQDVPLTRFVSTSKREVISTHRVITRNCGYGVMYIGIKDLCGYLVTKTGDVIHVGSVDPENKHIEVFEENLKRIMKDDLSCNVSGAASAAYYAAMIACTEHAVVEGHCYDGDDNGW